MHLLPRLRLQSLQQDRLHEARGGAVIQRQWRLSWRQAELDRNRMSLRGTNAQPVGRG
jgi:hypothetical protein